MIIETRSLNIKKLVNHLRKMLVMTACFLISCKSRQFGDDGASAQYFGRQNPVLISNQNCGAVKFENAVVVWADTRCSTLASKDNLVGSITANGLCLQVDRPFSYREACRLFKAAGSDERVSVYENSQCIVGRSPGGYFSGRSMCDDFPEDGRLFSSYFSNGSCKIFDGPKSFKAACILTKDSGDTAAVRFSPTANCSNPVATVSSRTNCRTLKIDPQLLSTYEAQGQCKKFSRYLDSQAACQLFQSAGSPDAVELSEFSNCSNPLAVVSKRTNCSYLPKDPQQYIVSYSVAGKCTRIDTPATLQDACQTLKYGGFLGNNFSW